MESWTSIELRTEEIADDAPGTTQDAGARLNRTVNHYVEANGGADRYYAQEIFWTNNRAQCEEWYRHGQKYARVFHRDGKNSPQWRVQIQDSFGSESNIPAAGRPYPIASLYLDGIPLHIALRDARAIGTGNLLGRPYVKCVIGPHTKSRATIIDEFDLDEATGVPLRTAVLEHVAGHENDHPLAIWEATALQTRERLLVAVESKLTVYAPTSERTANAKNTRPMLTRIHRVKEIKRDREYPANAFWPEIQSGAVVHDTTKRTHRSSTAAAINPTSSKTTAPNTHSVEPPAPNHLAPSIIALGIVLLLVGIALRLRRRT
jgi:hypothetical protein